MKFTAKVRHEIGYYVYLYLDPRTSKPFYLGKGKGNRAFKHLSSKGTSKKAKTLRELKKLGLEPTIEILKYGLTEKEAFLVESTAIDLLGIEDLTNEVRGHALKYGHRGSVAEINTLFGAKPVVIREKSILINVNQTFRYGMSHIELYDATRAAWKLNPARAKNATLAFCVYLGVVRQVYRIEAWFRGGAVMRSTDQDGRHTLSHDRWEFVGQVADERMCKRYVGRSVRDYMKAGSQNPIRYVNCE
jgi:uncharacterized protein